MTSPNNTVDQILDCARNLIKVAGHFTFLVDGLADVLARGQASGQTVLQQDAALEAQCFMALVQGGMLTGRALAMARHLPPSRRLRCGG